MSARARMLASVRERLQREFARKGLSPAQRRRVSRLLDPMRPEVLTIGFARRFATYKRATLLMRDRARLARLLRNAERPVLLLRGQIAVQRQHRDVRFEIGQFLRDLADLTQAGKKRQPIAVRHRECFADCRGHFRDQC